MLKYETPTIEIVLTNAIDMLEASGVEVEFPGEKWGMDV